jgi:TnpA family transposase
MSEAPYVLDGLHQHAHQTDLRIAEHYTDTAGATDHVFGLCHLLGFRFAPRIKDLKDRKLYAIEKPGTYQLLEPLIGDTVETAAVVSQWAVLLRLKASIQAGREGDALCHLAQARCVRVRQRSVARLAGTRLD